MLILDRKVGQQIEIGNGVIVTVCRVNKGRVKIGVEAPRCVPVRRVELERKDGAK